jgi:DNA-binding MarR family transcriptional regulator
MGHRELVRALGRDKSNISHSLRTLEARGLITIGRTPGGQADSVDLTAAGRKMAAAIA